jgi:hypothetical protein
MGSIGMKQWLQDEPPLSIDPSGAVNSPFPFEVYGECRRCHCFTVVVCGLLQCPACPDITRWLHESREKLAALKRKVA